MYVGSALVHKHITENNNWQFEVHVILARTDKIEKIICFVGRFRTKRFMDKFYVVFFENTQTICLLISNFSSFFFSGERQTEKKV